MPAGNRSSSTHARWLVTGVLGLAVLGTSGCATETAALTQQVGPAVVLNGPAEGRQAKPPATPTSTKASAGTGATAGDDKGSRDGTVKKVPPASPQSVNSPETPPSAPTP